jgi:hypothetical protein
VLKQYYKQVLFNIKEFKETKRFGYITKSFILFLIAVIPGTLTIASIYLFLKSYFDLKSE